DVRPRRRHLPRRERRRHGESRRDQRGGDAFVAGTDIAQFVDFKEASQALEYERRMDAWLGAIEDVRVPTIAAPRGPGGGGGLAIAAACDLRVAAPSARFGVPVARTLGNCFSAANL